MPCFIGFGVTPLVRPVSPVRSLTDRGAGRPRAASAVASRHFVWVAGPTQTAGRVQDDTAPPWHPVPVASRPVQERMVSLAEKPPGWRFHSLLVPPALAVLYAFSFPGIHVVLAIFATYALAAAVVVWLLRLIGYLVLRSRGRPPARDGGSRLLPLQQPSSQFSFGLTYRFEAAGLQVGARSRNWLPTSLRSVHPRKSPMPLIDASGFTG